MTTPGRRLQLLTCTASLTVLAGPLAAATSASPPPPTVAVTLAVPPDGHPATYPGTPAAWSVARPGHDATLSFRLLTATESDLVATWTSAPLRLSGPGPAVSLAVGRTYVQGDPAEDGDLLQVQARYRASTGSAWSSWTTPVTTWLGMGAKRGSPVTQGGTATHTVPYRGQGATTNLVVQLRILLTADRAGYLESSIHVTA